MTLIAVLLALVVEQYLGTLAQFRRYHWLERAGERLREVLPQRWRDSGLALSLLLIVPLLVISVLEEVFSSAGSVFALAFGFVVLLYSIGPQHVEAQVEAYLAARARTDEAAARWHAAEVLGSDVPEESRVLVRAMMERVLVELNERLLAIIFWFTVFGPAGALIYRLVVLLRDRTRDDPSAFADWTRRLHLVLGWIPARLTALGFGIAGSFVDAWQSWQQDASKWRDGNRGVLVSAGLGALQYGAIERTSPQSEIDDLEAVLALARRAVVVWVAVLALVIIVRVGT